MYRHGVYVSEQGTSLVPPARIGAGLPVVFGTAPVHLTQEGTGPVNVPKLCYSYKEAVQFFGFHEDWESWTLCEFFKSYFELFKVAPMVVVNVFDPTVHKTQVTDEAQTFAHGIINLAHGGLVADPIIKSEDGGTTHTLGSDVDVDWATGVVTRLPDGNIAATAKVKVSYAHAEPSLVDTDGIIGGIDGTTGKPTGLELINSVFPMFRMVPGQVVAPGWSKDPAVGAIMHAKASNINSHFKAMALADVDSDLVPLYSDVPGHKTKNNLTDELLVNCWPKVRLGKDEYWLSSQVAALCAQVDSKNEDIPHASPSNHNLQMTAAVAKGEEVWLGPEEGAHLNGQGIVTALNFVGGWKCWGNRTACYPGVTDVKDSFIALRRMFNWIANTLVLTYWQKIDNPANRRLIETALDSANIWLNGLSARQFILGGRVEFLEDENPTTDLMDGIIRFHTYITPPSPAVEIGFIQEYDPGYIKNLFG